MKLNGKEMGSYGLRIPVKGLLSMVPLALVIGAIRPAETPRIRLDVGDNRNLYRLVGVAFIKMKEGGCTVIDIITELMKKEIEGYEKSNQEYIDEFLDSCNCTEYFKMNPKFKECYPNLDCEDQPLP